MNNLGKIETTKKIRKFEHNFKKFSKNNYHGVLNF